MKKKETEPIVIQTNSVTDAKLEAIANLSEAILAVAKALDSVTTEVIISGNTFGDMGKAITAIKVQTAD